MAVFSPVTAGGAVGAGGRCLGMGVSSLWSLGLRLRLPFPSVSGHLSYVGTKEGT